MRHLMVLLLATSVLAGPLPPSPLNPAPDPFIVGPDTVLRPPLGWTPPPVSYPRCSGRQGCAAAAIVVCERFDGVRNTTTEIQQVDGETLLTKCIIECWAGRTITNWCFDTAPRPPGTPGCDPEFVGPRDCRWDPCAPGYPCPDWEV